MNIAVLTSLYPSGPLPLEGIFAQRRWLAMAERGHSVRIIRPVPRVPWPHLRPGWAELAAMSRREERAGLMIERPRYVHLPARDARNGRAFARAALPVLEGWGEAEVVVCDYAWPAAALAPELRRRGIPCVVHGRGSDVLEVAQHPALAAPLAGYLRSAGHWCAVSADLVSVMDRLAGQERGRLTPNGVDLEQFPLSSEVDRSAARSELDLPPDGRLFLAVGHLIPRKQPLVALAAFAGSASAGDHLVFLGRGPLAGELREAVRARGTPGGVRLVGEVQPEELARWYAAADLVLLPSTREGRPNVVLEALACGRPVLATDVGGTAEVLGACPELLVAGTGAREFSAALAGLLSGQGPRRSPEELRALVEPFTWASACEALEDSLAGALQGDPADRRGNSP